MKVDELRNSFCGVTDVRHYWTAEVTRFVYFWDSVKTSWLGRVFCKVCCCLFVDPIFVVSVCNDLLDIIEDCDGEIHMYADDTTICATASSPYIKRG